MKKHRLPLVLFITLVTLVLAASSVGAAPKEGPTASVSTLKSEFSAAEDVIISVTIANPSGHSVRILKWFTPMDGVEEPIFTLKVNGTAVNYTGAIYKRPAPTGSDYLTLKSGESRTYDVNLGDYYDLSASGPYRIYFYAASRNLYDEKGSSSILTDTLTSGMISVKIDGRAAKGKPTRTPTPTPAKNNYNACTVTQQDLLANARTNAASYAADAESYFLANKTGTRYTEWFGSYLSSRYLTVGPHFTSIRNAWDSASVNFDCGCKQNYYAYVYPNRPYTIYLCRVFWAAPATGTDSQAGTLIHEMSHFYTVASTDDYVYGQTGARNLADTNPDQAIDNADNHEYFAENNPSLP